MSLRCNKQMLLSAALANSAPGAKIMAEAKVVAQTRKEQSGMAEELDANLAKLSDDDTYALPLAALRRSHIFYT